MNCKRLLLNRLFRGLLPAAMLGSAGFSAHAQVFDSLQVQAGSTGSVSSGDVQPLWLESNRFGRISPEAQDLSTYLGVFNRHSLPLGRDSLSIHYGLNLVNNAHFRELAVQQGFLKLRYGALELRGGRYEEITGEVDPDLSTGSLGVSGNSLPVPRISLAFPDYVPVPFTKGWLQIKGTFSHGWMGGERYMQDAFLHEKTFYGRLGRGKFRVYGGLQHFGIWGGRRDNIRTERSFKAFLDVLFVKEANDGSHPSDSEKRPNRAGDQRGLLEWGASLESRLGNWHFYHQTPFESGKGIDIRNVDRLAGLSLELRESYATVQKILLEFIYTKQMESFDRSERQSYYNNGIYANGWEYQGRIIGTPLFLNRYRAANFLPVDLEAPYQNRNIVNNRVVGWHLGLMHSFGPRTKARTLFSYTLNYGTHSDFIPSVQRQFYSLHELRHQLKGGWGISLGLAWDTGMFYDAFGVLAGLDYRLPAFARTAGRP